MNSLICPLIRDPSTLKLKFEEPLKRMPPGLYGYKWTVTDETGSKHSLAGISQSLSKRLSTYIRQFNRPVDENSSLLHRYASDPASTVELEVFGPCDDDKCPKELEQELIASIPEAERLNKTSGGNGGGAWSQYDDPTPSVSVFPKDTPEKYYPFEKKENHIAAKFSPGFRKLKNGVYVIKHRKTGLRYVGHSTNAPQRLAVHASIATHRPKTKLHKALARSPENHVFGLLRSTAGLTPRSERAAEVFHIANKKPEYNSDKGGGGPAPMPKKLVFPT